MIVFDESKRVFPRTALGIKEIRIADDVRMGDEVTFDVDVNTGTGIYSKIESNPNEPSTEVTLVTNEIGLFGGNKLETIIDVVLMGESMVVTIVKGAVVIKPDENAMIASNQVYAEQLPDFRLEDVVWVSADYLRGFCTRFGKYADMYTEDYLYELSVSGGIIGGMSSIVVSKYADSCDMSLGKFAELERREEVHQQALKAKALASMFTQPVKPIEIDSSPEEELVADGYEDADDDDFGVQ